MIKRHQQHIHNNVRTKGEEKMGQKTETYNATSFNTHEIKIWKEQIKKEEIKSNLVIM